MAEVCRDPTAVGYPGLAFKFESERLLAGGADVQIGATAAD
jgi:hypothetical protein